MFTEVGYEHSVKTVRFTNMKGDEKKDNKKDGEEATKWTINILIGFCL